ncbi:MAG: hypothetical protein QXH56_06735 [Thermoprotei archaeon]
MSVPKVVQENPWMCALCKGVRHLCGTSPCPLIVRAASIYTVDLQPGERVYGSSPPSAFMGEWGYPRIMGGPLVPLSSGDTSLYEDSSRWLELGFPKLIEMRLSLVRLTTRLDIHAKGDERTLGRIQEVALGSKPVDVEAKLSSTLREKPSFSFYTPPMGPAAKLEAILYVGNPSVPRAVERVTGDLDLPAAEGMLELWRSGVGVDHTQRLLSAGLLGRRRMLVPTRWSITAVDDTLSRSLIAKLKHMPTLDKTVAGFHRALGNSFGVVLVGGRGWWYEMLESWAPYVGAIGDESYIVPSDWEDARGRTSYASNLGGAYYAARLAVANHLYNAGKQAGVFVLMEVDREWLAPLGVWRVREGVRQALTKLQEFENPRVALESIIRLMATPRLSWVRGSVILRNTLLGRTLDEFGG